MENEELSAAPAEKLFNGTHRGVEALVEIYFLTFYSIFCIFF
jgi:hypothetical protein